MATKKEKVPSIPAVRRRIETPAVLKVMAEIEKLIHLEPVCIKCGCTEYDPCPEGCAWVFLNKQNEGLCSVCMEKLQATVGKRVGWMRKNAPRPDAIDTHIDESRRQS